jgi:hypothetical protein
MDRPIAIPLLLAATAALAAATGTHAARAADPTLSDCISANEASLQARADHKLRQAREQSLLCAADRCPSEMRDQCRHRVAQVNATMPTIVFAVQDGSGADLGAVKVSMDGTPIADRLEGTAISLDPGEHKFTFEVAGQPPVEKTFILREGEKNRREKIVIGPPAAAAPTNPPSSRPESPSNETASPNQGGSNLKTVGLVVGGVGIAGLVVGVVSAIIAHNKRTEGDGDCPGGRCPAADRAQIDSLDGDATTAGKIAAVSFVVGGLAAAGGAVLLIFGNNLARPTNPGSSTRLVPWIGLSSAGVFGTFQ